jgi:hypothetical protein
MNFTIPQALIALIKLALTSYHALMDKIIRQGGKEVRVFRTPEGVVGIVDTSIPKEALDALASKLRARISARSANAPLGPSGKPGINLK